MHPKVKSYAAPWLSASNPGAALFDPAPRDKSIATSTSPAKRSSALSQYKKPEPGPRRTIARKSTQVFVAVGKEIRWADLAYIRERYNDAPRIKREDSAEPFPHDEEIGPIPAAGVRIIKIPNIADDIRQLIMSPNETLCAVLTKHTVHVFELPDSSLLTKFDGTPIKPRYWTLGATTHVTSKAAVASVIWHPLGVKGECIVTITTDAVVRVWELSIGNRWTFERPTLSVDLQKLADGTYLDDKAYTGSANATNTSSAFSPDAVDMEVVAAAFASRGSGDWSPMTLWIAMREGDVYALCPLLPQKWAPPPTLIPSLSVSIVTRHTALEDDETVTAQEKLLARNQLDWIGEIDKQEPQVVDGPLDEPPVEVYQRPSLPGVIPRLQGPFQLKGSPLGDELDRQLTDVLVIGKKLETDDLMDGEDDVELESDGLEGQGGLSLAIVCVLSGSGQVRVCLDIEGVEAQWLPPRGAVASLLARRDVESLLTVQCFDTMSENEVKAFEGNTWPLFSPDIMSRYDFYVSHHGGITYASLSWVFRLESDLQADSDPDERGAQFRLNMVAKSPVVRDRLYSRHALDKEVPLAAALAIRDPDLGYMLLSSTPYESVVLTFESSELDLEGPQTGHTSAAPLVLDDDIKPVDFYEPRPAFNPSHVFDQPSDMPAFLSRLRASHHRTLVNQEVRLSPATLQIFTDAHLLLGDETHRLGEAVSVVFLRCGLLQEELRKQIIKVGELKDKIDKISGHGGDGESDETRISNRLSRAHKRQDELTKRLDTIQEKTSNGVMRPLSDKEKAFADEVRSKWRSLMGESPEGDTTPPLSSSTRQDASRLREKLERVEKLGATLFEDAGQVIKKQAENEDESKESPASVRPPRAGDLRIPSEIKKAKFQQVFGMLDRENEIVEALSERLARLMNL